MYGEQVIVHAWGWLVALARPYSSLQRAIKTLADIL